MWISLYYMHHPQRQLWDSEVARHYLAYYYGLHEAVKAFPSLAQAVPNLPAPLK